MVSDRVEIPSVLDGINPLRIRFIPLNARLVDTRKAKGWTQSELAMLTGIHQKEISAIETLRRPPTKVEKFELASALEAEVEYLFPESLMDIVRSGVISQKRIVELGDEKLLRLVKARQNLMLESGRNVETEMIERVNVALLKPQIEAVLETLTPREQKVIRLRFGIGDGVSHTLEEVGKLPEFGVTPDRIRQIESEALRKLRHPHLSRKLKDLLE